MKHLALAAAAAAVLAAGVAQAGDMLINPGFDTASGLGPTAFSGLSDGGLSSAAAWRVWNNTQALTTTDQVASTDPFGGGAATHVVTGGAENGLFQFVAANSVNFVSVDVFLLSGTFELGLGQSGYYAATAKTSLHDQWVHLTASYPPLPLAGSPFPNQIGNEIFLYATNGAGAEFYVDNAFAGTRAVPEPASWALMILGFGASGVRLRRRATPA
jgi:hypothetical protein